MAEIINRRAFLKMAATSMITLPGVTFAVKPKWDVRSDLPYSVQEIYPALHKDKIVVAGGLAAKSDGLEVVDDVVEYSDSKDQWKAMPSLPEPRHHPYLISLGDQLYALSGFTKSESGLWFGSRDVLVLDEEHNQWRKLDSKMPAPLCETVGATINGRVHLASGRQPIKGQNGQWRDHSDSNSHYVFDPKDKKWSLARPIPTARNSAASVFHNDLWHVVGGRTVGGGNTGVHEVYDAKTDRWQSLAPMPQAQGGLAAAMLGDYMYVFGGEYFNNGGGVYSEVWQYSFKQDRWQQVGRMPVPRHGLGAVTLNDHIYVVAGAAQVGGRDTTNRLSVFKI